MMNNKMFSFQNKMMDDSGDYSADGDLGKFEKKVAVAVPEKPCGLLSVLDLNLTEDYGKCMRISEHGLCRSVSAVCERPPLGTTCIRRASFCGKRNDSFCECGKNEHLEVRRKNTGQKNFSTLLKSLTKRRDEHDYADNELQEELRQSKQTIAILESKMEVYEELLNSKYKAIEVLLQQLGETIIKKEAENSKRNQENSENNAQINKLQYSLLCTEDTLVESQRVWLERFNSVLQENIEFQKAVQSQAHTLQNLLYEKQVLSRDNQELLALQDAKERMVYQRSNSLLNDETETTALELAVLGACSCRSVMQQPCACARSACTKQKFITEMQAEVSGMRRRASQAERIADIYKNAFEEQLQRNHKLKKQGLLSEYRKETMLNLQRISGITRKKDMNKTIASLLDTVCEKTDELFQQKLLTKLLAQRVAELESLQKCQA